MKKHKTIFINKRKHIVLVIFKTKVKILQIKPLLVF